MNDEHLTKIMSDVMPEVISLRRSFHKLPELAFKEFETSKMIGRYLDQLGLPYKMIAETGVVSDLIINPNDPTLAIRAEMDAIAVEDGTCCDYSSSTPGVSHACGHDGIMAIALGLANLLLRLKDSLRYNIKFIFQPAEEIGQGARRLIGHGVLEDPKVDKMLIFHLSNSTPRGMILQKEFATAATGTLVIKVHGRSSHLNHQSEGKNAIHIASKVIVEIERFNAAFKSVQPFVVGVGTIHGGVKSNVIPDLAEIKCTLRACSREEQYRICHGLDELFGEIARHNNTSIETEFIPGPPSLVNDSAMLKEAISVGQEVFGPEHVMIKDEMPLIGDDAAYYFEKVPGVKLVFCGPKNGPNYPSHNPQFDFDEAILPAAIKSILKLIDRI